MRIQKKNLSLKHCLCSHTVMLRQAQRMNSIVRMIRNAIRVRRANSRNGFLTNHRRQGMLHKITNTKYSGNEESMSILTINRVYRVPTYSRHIAWTQKRLNSKYFNGNLSKNCNGLTMGS